MMKAFLGLLTFLCAVLLLASGAFVAIAITTGHSVRFWQEPVIPPVASQTIEPVGTPVDKSVEINFVFCREPDDGAELNAGNCTPLAIRDDSTVHVQLAMGAPIVIDGFRDVKTGFKIRIDSGDTVMAISIENDYFPTTTFGESTLRLEKVSQPRTVYLPL